MRQITATNRQLACALPLIALFALPAAAQAPGPGSGLGAVAGATASRAALPELWGVQPHGRRAPDAAALRSLRASGFNALVRKRPSPTLRRRARAAELILLAPRARRCGRAARCVRGAPTMRKARRLAARDAVDVVVVRFDDPRAVARVRLPRTGRVLAVVRLGVRRPLATRAWRRAIERAHKRRTLDLAVAPTARGPVAEHALDAYAALLAPVLGRRGAPPPGTPPAAPTPPPAVFVAPTGSDGNPCSAEAPCASFDRAYRVAQPGEGIQIAGGVYPEQTVQVDPSKVDAPADVVFFPAPGEVVTLDGDLVMYGSHAIFRGSPAPFNFKVRMILSEAVEGAQTSNNVRFEHIDGAAFSINANRSITILGGDWGPNVLCAAGAAEENKIGPNGNIPGQIPRDIVLDGLYIHDQNSADLAQCHTGGLMVISADGLTIRNTTFSQTAVYDMSVGDFTRAGDVPAYGHPRRVLLENNWFGAPVEQDGITNDEQPELQFSEDGLFEDWLIRFNSFHNGLRLAWDAGARWRDVRVIGNVGGTMDCNATDANVVWEQNAWVDSPCTGADRRLPSLPYVSAAVGSEDFHLTGGAAQDLVTGTGSDHALGVDVDGQARPRGAARDAGSDER